MTYDELQAAMETPRFRELEAEIRGHWEAYRAGLRTINREFPLDPGAEVFWMLWDKGNVALYPRTGFDLSDMGLEEHEG